MMKSHPLTLMSLVAASLLAGCATAVHAPNLDQAKQDAAIKPAANWQAALPASATPLPHGGSAAQLAQWWSQLGDTALDALMQSAQKESATLAGARARLVQARAGVAEANAALGPQMGANVQGSRGVQGAGAPVQSQLNGGVQASWEVDVWGGNQASQRSAQLRARGAELGWHDMRVLVAAEVALSYMSLRHCEMLLAVQEQDAASRRETARLSSLTSQAGFAPPAQALLAKASSLEADSSVAATRASCELTVKSLVALSGIAEPELRPVLELNKAKAGEFIKKLATFNIANMVPSLPAQVLAQRPDIALAQDAVTAAALDAQAASAKQYPSLSLSGSVGYGSSRQLGMTNSGVSWSLGPVALNIPITAQKQIAARTEALVAAYDESVVSLRSKVRQAVREVEEGMLNMSSTQQRSVAALGAAEGYAAHLAATQARYKAGLASLVELEDARRITLGAQLSVLSIERERVIAWVSLYRAVGGGWDASATLPNMQKP
jgi:outer membrane protein, multidrug efflux system